MACHSSYPVPVPAPAPVPQRVFIVYCLFSSTKELSSTPHKSERKDEEFPLFLSSFIFSFDDSVIVSHSF